MDYPHPFTLGQQVIDAGGDKAEVVHIHNDEKLYRGDYAYDLKYTDGTIVEMVFEWDVQAEDGR